MCHKISFQKGIHLNNFFIYVTTTKCQFMAVSLYPSLLFSVFSKQSMPKVWLFSQTEKLQNNTQDVCHKYWSSMSSPVELG